MMHEPDKHTKRNVDSLSLARARILFDLVLLPPHHQSYPVAFLHPIKHSSKPEQLPAPSSTLSRTPRPTNFNHLNNVPSPCPHHRYGHLWLRVSHSLSPHFYPPLS